MATAKKHLVQSVRFSQAERMGAVQPLIQCKQRRSHHGRCLAQPLPAEDRQRQQGQHTAQGAEEAKSQSVIAEQPVAQRHHPIGKRRLQVPVIRLTLVGMHQIIVILDHFIGVDSVPRLVVIHDFRRVQPKEKAKTCNTENNHERRAGAHGLTFFLAHSLFHQHQFPTYARRTLSSCSRSEAEPSLTILPVSST